MVVQRIETIEKTGIETIEKTLQRDGSTGKGSAVCARGCDRLGRKRLQRESGF